MENLTGKTNCDTQVEKELTECGIEVIREEEEYSGKFCASTSISGALGSFKFARLWENWLVAGLVPLAVARELYNDPVCKADIRIVFNLEGSGLENEVTYIDQDGYILHKSEDIKLAEVVNCLTSKFLDASIGIRAVEDPSAEGEAFIVGYYIDSEVALRVFVDTLKRHDLV